MLIFIEKTDSKIPNDGVPWHWKLTEYITMEYLQRQNCLQIWDMRIKIHCKINTCTRYFSSYWIKMQPYENNYQTWVCSKGCKVLSKLNWGDLWNQETN